MRVVADRAATVKRIVAGPDTEVDAKDLLVELESRRPRVVRSGFPRTV